MTKFDQLRALREARFEARPVSAPAPKPVVSRIAAPAPVPVAEVREEMPPVTVRKARSRLYAEPGVCVVCDERRSRAALRMREWRKGRRGV